MQISIFALIFSAMAGFLSFQALASETSIPTPNDYSAELIELESNCGSNIVLNKYYDCDCVSKKYIEEREELGPNPDSTIVILNISKYCHRSDTLIKEELASCVKDKCNGIKWEKNTVVVIVSR